MKECIRLYCARVFFRLSQQLFIQTKLIIQPYSQERQGQASSFGNRLDVAQVNSKLNRFYN